MEFTFLAGAFGAAFLLAQFGTGQAQLLRGSEPVAAKSQPGEDATRRAPFEMTRLPRSSWILFSARGKRLSAIGASPTMAVGP
jgi:hypothetical protein